MAKQQGSQTILRVIKGTVGAGAKAFEIGETFVAEKIGADVAHLLRAGAVEIVSQSEADTAPSGPAYSADERIAIDRGISAAHTAILGAVDLLGGFKPAETDDLGEIAASLNPAVTAYVTAHEALASQEETNRQRSTEIANELVAAHAQTVRALGLLGIEYDSSLNAGQLASVLADGVDAYVRKTRGEVLQDAMSAAAQQAP